MPGKRADIEKQKKQAQKYQRAVIYTIIAFLAIGAIIITLDYSHIGDIISRARWSFASYAIIATFVVYLAQSSSYVIINRTMGIGLGRLELLEIGFVSIALGNVVGIIGAVEHIVRSLLIVPRGYRLGDVVAASLIHSYFKDLAILVLVPVGLLILLLSQSLPLHEFIGFLGLLIVALALLLVITLALLFRPLRWRLLQLFGKLWRLLAKMVHPMRRHQPDAEIKRLDSAVERGKEVFRKKPFTLTLIVLFMLADWVFTLVALEFTFMSFNVMVPVGILMTGYTLGKIAGIANFIPGGVGVTAASRAGAYHLFGIPLAVGLLVSILFRVIYYYLPYLVSFAFYRYLLSRSFVKREETR